MNNVRAGKHSGSIASKFWQMKIMVVWWSGGQAKLAAVVLLLIISAQKQFQNLKLQDEKNNEVRAN